MESTLSDQSQNMSKPITRPDLKLPSLDHFSEYTRFARRNTTDSTSSVRRNSLGFQDIWPPFQPTTAAYKTPPLEEKRPSGLVIGPRKQGTTAAHGGAKIRDQVGPGQVDIPSKCGAS